ncbi:hypothetical protein SYNTR_0656 [Candidatus Syntrophocurvum alkaliphilum]|uniref:Thioesterase domain-containing protein n=1 Tax=Candidatus Syntrophocurvum alkaliphilum TaxID=2293317 RepID=A0A6I6DI74_9FIRM|nr:PaaI family thioesterase [Candidatus Syntrophocurvum alkaliphilum]QGT99249.1 hypothetical protein SYNTR_0656 [Candidatus Syntrophocurvum alkaliphilum]
MSKQYESISEQLYKHIKESIDATPYYRTLGMYLKTIYSGYAEIAVQTKQDHTNPIGMIHGGLIMSIADAAMGNSIRSLGIKAVTVDMSTSFLDGAKINDEIIAVGKVIKTGNKLYFSEAFVYANDKVISHNKGTFYKLGEIDL